MVDQCLVMLIVCGELDTVSAQHNGPVVRNNYYNLDKSYGFRRLARNPGSINHVASAFPKISKIVVWNTNVTCTVALCGPLWPFVALCGPCTCH